MFAAAQDVHDGDVRGGHVDSGIPGIWRRVGGHRGADLVTVSRRGEQLAPVSAAGPPVPGRIPTGPAGRPGTTGTPASRPPGQRPRHRHPGTAARQAGLPGRLGHEPSLPGTGRPGQGALVLHHAPPPPGPQPRSRTLPQTGTLTTRHSARHARCQPRSPDGTLMATVTPSTAARPRRVPWTLSDDATPAPQGHPQRRGTAGQRPATRVGVAGAGSGPDVRVL